MTMDQKQLFQSCFSHWLVSPNRVLFVFIYAKAINEQIWAASGPQICLFDPLSVLKIVIATFFKWDLFFNEISHRSLDFWLLLKEDWAILDPCSPHGKTPWELGCCCQRRGAMLPTWPSCEHLSPLGPLCSLCTCPGRHWANSLDCIFINLCNILFFSWLAMPGALLADASGRMEAWTGKDFCHHGWPLPSFLLHADQGKGGRQEVPLHNPECPRWLGLVHQRKDFNSGRCTEYLTWTCPCKKWECPSMLSLWLPQSPITSAGVCIGRELPKWANYCSLTQDLALLLFAPLCVHACMLSHYSRV